MARVGENAHIARSILVLGSMVTADTNVVSQVRVDFMFQVTDHDKYKAENGGPHAWTKSHSPYMAVAHTKAHMLA